MLVYWQSISATNNSYNVLPAQLHMQPMDMIMYTWTAGRDQVLYEQDLELYSIMY